MRMPPDISETKQDSGACPRRVFIRRAAALAGSLVLGGTTGHAEPSDVQMAIAKWDNPLDSDEGLKSVAVKLAERAIADLGGMSRFVKRNDVVWLKPNMAFAMAPEYAVNTNPDVVAALVTMCLEAGAKEVKVGDSGLSGAVLAYKASGIADAVIAAGGNPVMPDKTRFKDFAIKGERLHTWPMYTEMMEADLLINVPIVKQHPLTRVSACMKNLMGVAGGMRGQWHADLVTCLNDIASFVRPRLCVVDAIRMLTKGGPMGGELDDVMRAGIVAAGVDIVALDAFSATLLGLNPAESKTMDKAEKRGLGTRDYSKINLRESVVS
ncbi:MAG TPA: DUF362 domain-containing protein [Candidatus Hydrogenedentes bacterium]|nr:DUF362 domain-containing protein [Candidatus Hydrogenedentota bacterium]